jgi:hypothetical protein
VLSLVIPPPFGPEKSLGVSEGGGTPREHSYAWTCELAMNLLNGKDDGYKGMLNLCTYVNVLFDNKYKKSIKTNFTELILFTMPIQVELNFTVSE